MADNYLEKRMEDYRRRKEKEARSKQLAWRKRMDAYRKKIASSEVPEDGVSSKGPEASDEQE